MSYLFLRVSDTPNIWNSVSAHCHVRDTRVSVVMTSDNVSDDSDHDARMNNSGALGTALPLSGC